MFPLDPGLFFCLGLLHQPDSPTSLTVVVRSSTPVTFTGIGGSHLIVTDLASGWSRLPTPNECQCALRICGRGLAWVPVASVGSCSDNACLKAAPRRYPTSHRLG